MHITSSIHIENNILHFEDRSISLDEVTAIKYGTRSIELDMYAIGTCYTMELHAAQNNMKINFKSYFGISRTARYEEYTKLMSEIWEPVVVRLLNEYIHMLEDGMPVEIGPCKITPDGITLKNFLITWDDLIYQVNYNKLTINSKSRSDIWTNLYYLETNNVRIAAHLLDWKFKSVTQASDPADSGGPDAFQAQAR